MTDNRKITVENRIEQLPALARFAGEICDELKVSDKLRNEILVTIDEIGANIAMYAYPDGEINSFSLHFHLEGDDMIFVFEDNGEAFDPTERADPDITATIEERPIGGLGIFISRRLMDRLEYKRVGSSNVLKITKHIER